MSNKSINKFIFRTIIAAIPLIIIVASYLILDPFKVVRYYGIYSKEHKQSKKIFRLLNSNQIMIRQILRKWNLLKDL